MWSILVTRMFSCCGGTARIIAENELVEGQKLSGLAEDGQKENNVGVGDNGMDERMQRRREVAEDEHQEEDEEDHPGSPQRDASLTEEESKLVDLTFTPRSLGKLLNDDNVMATFTPRERKLYERLTIPLETFSPRFSNHRVGESYSDGWSFRAGEEGATEDDLVFLPVPPGVSPRNGCKHVSYEERYRLLTNMFRDFVMELNRGVYLTQMAATREYVKIHCSLDDRLQVLTLDQNTGCLVEFPTSGMERVFTKKIWAPTPPQPPPSVQRSVVNGNAATCPHGPFSRVGGSCAACAGGPSGPTAGHNSSSSASSSSSGSATSVVPKLDLSRLDGGGGGGQRQGAVSSGGDTTAATERIEGITDGRQSGKTASNTTRTIITTTAAPDDRAHYIVVVEFQRRKLIFVFNNSVDAERFQMCMEMLAKKASAKGCDRPASVTAAVPCDASQLPDTPHIVRRQLSSKTNQLQRRPHSAAAAVSASSSVRFSRTFAEPKSRMASPSCISCCSNENNNNNNESVAESSCLEVGDEIDSKTTTQESSEAPCDENERERRSALEEAVTAIASEMRRTSFLGGVVGRGCDSLRGRGECGDGKVDCSGDENAGGDVEGNL